MRVLPIAMACAALLLPSLASAEYLPGAYIGGGLGMSTLEAVDDSGSSFRFHGGYQFNSYLGAEGGFDYLALIEREYCYYDYCSGSEDQSLYGLSFGLTGALPLGSNFNLLAKAGLLFWQTDIDDDSEADGTDPYFGFGASYQITPHMDLSLMYTYYELSGFADTVIDTYDYQDDDQLTNIALLFEYRF